MSYSVSMFFNTNFFSVALNVHSLCGSVAYQGFYQYSSAFLSGLLYIKTNNRRRNQKIKNKISTREIVRFYWPSVSIKNNPRLQIQTKTEVVRRDMWKHKTQP